MRFYQPITRPASFAHAKICMGWTSFHSAAAGSVMCKKGNMIKQLTLIIFLLFFHALSNAEEMDPNEIQIGPILHESLPESLLVRIKALTDTFYEFDNIGYEQSVDLYKRDLDPESNILIYEEMARVYKGFCSKHCLSKAAKIEAYKLVLLRSMFPGLEALEKVSLSEITRKEAIELLNSYKLNAEPITVYEK